MKALAAIVLAVLVSGCNAAGEEGVKTLPGVDNNAIYFEVDTPNGPLPCVAFDSGFGAGITCGWGSDD